MTQDFMVYAGLSLFAVAVILFIIKTGPRSSSNGRWISEVYLLGEYGFKEIIYRDRFNFLRDSEVNSVQIANHIRKKLIKRHGEGTYPGSVNVKGRSLVVMTRNYHMPETNESDYVRPIETYKVLL